ncbi:hypothetical protein HHL28_00865 [Aerophototrophica crusticola]|uniref:Uncharacterized protein n=1 Tax=Aerophototrophica crusticola TaxID=1709002 RepID=A0A858R3T6_9PROT|nr:hypothetical protein HHL28_00865 [Rhodospirillaceae bacterium B3]
MATNDETRRPGSERVTDVPNDPLHVREDGGFAGLSSTPEEHRKRAREGGDTGRRHNGDIVPEQAQEDSEQTSQHLVKPRGVDDKPA